MGQCKGIAITSRLSWVEQNHGQEGLDLLFASLNPNQRTLLEARVLPHAWVPIDLFLALNVNADRLFGTGDLTLSTTLGAWAAKRNLPTIFRMFYRFGTPMFVFEKAAKLWNQHYDSGILEPSSPGPNEARLVLRDFETPQRAHCLSVLGWASKSVEMSGGKQVLGDEPQCRTRGDAVCEFRLRWS